MRSFIFILAISSVFSPIAWAQSVADIPGKSEQAIRFWDEFYERNFFSKGIKPEDMKGTGYYPYLRMKWLYEMKKNGDGIVDEERRWEEFRRFRQNALQRDGTTPAAQWQSIGPNTIDSMAGRMICHAFDPTDSQTLWTGAGSGGLWRTTNGGETWESMTDELPSLYVSCIAIKPTNRNVMLLGTGIFEQFGFSLAPGVGVLKSTDRGITWLPTGFSVSPSAGVGTFGFAWHSNDANTVYLAATNGVWKSTDEGDTWSQLRTGRASTILLNPASPNIMYTALQADGIYRTTDAGTSWMRMESGLPVGTTIGLSSLAMSRAAPSVLYAGLSTASNSLLGLYKSTNGGDSWNLLAGTPNVFCYPPPNTNVCQGWLNNVLGVSPDNPDLLFFGGIRLFRSSDGGASWTWHDWTSNGLQYSNAGLTYVDQWDIGFDPANPGTVYVFNDGGVQKSTNGGLWWNKVNKDLVTGQLYKIASAPSDTNLVIAGFQDHGLQWLNASGGNARWYRWSANDGMAVIIHPTNTNIFYGDFFFGYHNKSTTGGANWRTNTFPINNGMTESGPIVAPLVMHPLDPNVLYCAGVTKIFRTTNGGSLWSPIADVPNVRTIAIDQQNPDVFYAHSYTNTTWTIWRSTDGGSGWTPITHPSIPSWRVVDLKVDPSTSGTLYAVRNSASANQDHIKKSTDFGETWSDITANLPDVTMSAIAVSPYSSHHLYVATDLGVFATTNGGAEWFEFNDGLPLVYATDIHYHPLDRTLRLSTLGRGAWKTKALDAGVTSAGEGIAAELPGGFRLHQNYPNPFNPSTTIRFELRGESRVLITIHNQLGQEIRRLVDGDVQQGEHSLVWDGMNRNGLPVSSGVYYVRGRTDGFSTTVKIVLTR